MGRIQNLLKDQPDVKDSGTSKPDSELAPLSRPFWMCLVCEFVGTFFLIFIGCAVGLKYTKEDEDKPLVQVALCWGFIIASLAQTLHYSCDLNPAVTLARLATGNMTIVKTLLYIITQCVGCLAGAFALKLLTPDDIVGDYGITRLAPAVVPGKGVVIEGICTFFLVFTVFSASDGERQDLKGSIPLSVGLCISGLIMTAAPYTAASFNPARTLGPSIVAGNFENHWVYWVGPITGGVLGGLVYHHVFRLRRIGLGQVEQPASV